MDVHKYVQFVRKLQSVPIPHNACCSSIFTRVGGGGYRLIDTGLFAALSIQGQKCKYVSGKLFKNLSDETGASFLFQVNEKEKNVWTRLPKNEKYCDRTLYNKIFSSAVGAADLTKKKWLTCAWKVNDLRRIMRIPLSIKKGQENNVCKAAEDFLNNFISSEQRTTFGFKTRNEKSSSSSALIQDSVDDLSETQICQ